MLKQFGFLCLIASMTLSLEAKTIKQVEAVNKDSQLSVDITIYNDFALVREVRSVTLPKGTVSLEYQDVPSAINASSVLTRSLKHPDALVVLEQSYQYQLLNRQNLLKHYIGKPVTYVESIENSSGASDKVRRAGKLLAINPEIVDFDGQIEISPAGVVALDDLPKNLALRPTLVWLMSNKQKGVHEIETSYLVNSLGWSADYVLVLDEDQRSFDLNSWVNIKNQSGGAYDQVGIALIAGEVNRVQAHTKQRQFNRLESFAMDSAQPRIQAQQVFDYHQYTLPNRTNLKHNETRQIRFLDASDIKYSKAYRVTSQAQNYRIQQPEERHPEIRLTFLNHKDNALGQPLPAGTAKVYARQEGGKLLLLGEDQVPHTAESEDVNLTVGKAFDIKVIRTQKSFEQLSPKRVRIEYEVEIRNQKSEQVVVDLREKLYGDWRILAQSLKGKKLNSQTQVYEIKVPAKGSTTLTYQAEVRL